MSRAIIIPVEGEVYEVDVDLNDWGAVNATIGANYVEVLRIRDRSHLMLIDEDGRRIGKTENVAATILANRMIVGDVIIVGDNGGEDFIATTVPSGEGFNQWVSRCIS